MVKLKAWVNVHIIMRMFKIWIFKRLLRWYINNEMDQWERWEIRMDARHGNYGLSPYAYITISLETDCHGYSPLTPKDKR